jgi:hypothetical protein
VPTPVNKDGPLFVLIILFYYIILTFVASLPAPYQLCGGSLGVDYAPMLMRSAVLAAAAADKVAAHYILGNVKVSFYAFLDGPAAERVCYPLRAVEFFAMSGHAAMNAAI